MNKVLIGAIVLVVVVGGWFLFKGDTINYVATIEDEVTQLEQELADIEAAIESGDLTPLEAAKAQIKIAKRLDAINSAVESSGNASLSSAQRAQLLGGLDRLKNVLTDYRGTLGVVDNAVLELPESERPKFKRGGGGSSKSESGSVTDVIVETIDVVQEYVEEVVDDYVADEDDGQATSTDDGVDDSATSTSTTPTEEGTGDENPGDGDESEASDDGIVEEEGETPDATTTEEELAV